MATLRDELAEKTKAKIIELFGPESALAQAMEDDDFLEKLAQLVAWIYGEIMLSQPRPERPTPTPPLPYQPRPVTTPWGERGNRDDKWIAAPAGPFIQKLGSAMQATGGSGGMKGPKGGV